MTPIKVPFTANTPDNPVPKECPIEWPDGDEVQEVLLIVPYDSVERCLRINEEGLYVTEAHEWEASDIVAWALIQITY